MQLLSNLEKEFKEVFGEIQDHPGDTKLESDFENLLTEIDKELKTLNDQDVWPRFTGRYRKESSSVEHAVHDRSLNTEEGRTQQLKRCIIGNKTYEVGDRWKDDETGKDMICILMNIPREVQPTLADADITLTSGHDHLPVEKILHAKDSESKESIGERKFNSKMDFEQSVRKKYTGGVDEALSATLDLPEKLENIYRLQEEIDEGGRENKIETLKSQDEQNKIMLSQIEELPEKRSIKQNLNKNDEDLKTKVVKTIKEEIFSPNNAPDKLENRDTYIKTPKNDSIRLKDSDEFKELLHGSSQIPQETAELVGNKNQVYPNIFIKETVEKHRRLQRTVETIETITTG